MNVNISNLDTTLEHWASIDGYLNYQVSWWGRVLNTKTGRILKGRANPNGYMSVNLSKKGSKPKTHFIHKLVAREWVSNPDGKACVDHIDGCRTNNHHDNLRFATHSENSRNQKKDSDGSSIYKGVSWDKKANKWRAQIKINGKVRTLGRYSVEKEAAETHNKAAAENYGEFAKLNTFTD